MRGGFDQMQSMMGITLYLLLMQACMVMGNDSIMNQNNEFLSFLLADTLIDPTPEKLYLLNSLDDSKDKEILKRLLDYKDYGVYDKIERLLLMLSKSRFTSDWDSLDIIYHHSYFMQLEGKEKGPFIMSKHSFIKFMHLLLANHNEYNLYAVKKSVQFLYSFLKSYSSISTLVLVKDMIDVMVEQIDRSFFNAFLKSSINFGISIHSYSKMLTLFISHQWYDELDLLVTHLLMKPPLNLFTNNVGMIHQTERIRQEWHLLIYQSIQSSYSNDHIKKRLLAMHKHHLSNLYWSVAYNLFSLDVKESRLEFLDLYDISKFRKEDIYEAFKYALENKNENVLKWFLKKNIVPFLNQKQLINLSRKLGQKKNYNLIRSELHHQITLHLSWINKLRIRI